MGMSIGVLVLLPLPRGTAHSFPRGRHSAQWTLVRDYLD